MMEVIEGLAQLRCTVQVAILEIEKAARQVDWYSIDGESRRAYLSTSEVQNAVAKLRSLEDSIECEIAYITEAAKWTE